MKIRIKNPIWGIPITGLKYLWSDGTIHTEYNGITTQFEIIGIANSARYIGNFPCLTIINGKRIYNRILIKKVS